jgi:TP901 family phage tail tape measure protein
MADTKDYILSINAQLKGNQVVLTGLQSIQGQTKQFTKTVNIAGKSTQDFGDIIQKAGERALIVAPVWLALRAVMTAIIDTIKDMIKQNMDLEDNMAKLQSTIRGTTSEVTAQMTQIKNLILDTAMSSDKNLKELSDAYIQLQKTLGNTSLAMAGFKATETLMTDTGLSATEAGKIMAKTYLEVGSTMDKSLSPAEKFQKISDTLIYTTKNQGVEIEGLIQGYGKLAPFLTGTSDKFENIITLLGLLSTHFVEGGRAGQGLSTEIVNLGKNSKALADIFNIQFNPNAPISIIQTFTQLREKIKETTKLDASQSEALSKIFGGARTSAPSREILTFFDELITKLKETEENSKGFGDRVKEAISNTTSFQLKELSNGLAVLANDFTTGATKGAGIVQFLKEFNEALHLARSPLKELGNEWGYFVEILQRITPVGLITQALGALSVGQAPQFEMLRSYRAFLAERKRAEEDAQINAKVLKAVEEGKQEQQALNLNSRKEEVEYTKELGSLLQALGANESQILEIKMRELDANHINMTDSDYLLEREKLRLQQVVAIQKEKEKEALAQANLAFQYEKADEMERGRLRRMMELRNFSTEDLVKQFQTSPYDARLIEQYRTNFSKEQQLAIGKTLEEKYKLPETPMPGISQIPEDEIKQLKSGALVFWDEWTSKSHDALKEFGNEFARTVLQSHEGLGVLAGGFPGGETIKDRIMRENPDYVFKTDIAKVEVNLPANALDKVADEAGKAVQKSLETNEDLQRRLAKKLRPYI